MTSPYGPAETAPMTHPPVDSAPEPAPAGSPPRFTFDVRVPAEHHYEVEYGTGLLAEYGRRLVERLGRRMYVVLTDSRVESLYGDALVESFRRAGVDPPVLSVPPGEPSKSLATYAGLLDRLTELGVDRRAVLVNFGGGVVSDLGGFVAASYMRGIEYVNFATSLIGQLDASLGGKVAVNSPAAKNLIGAFHHPSHVAGDPALLRTLTLRDLRSGLAEAVKVGVLCGGRLFELLERESSRILARDEARLVEVVGLAGRLKMDLIAEDPYERDLRRPLNLGHTIGHPIETVFGYRKIRHGEAVAIGTGVATALSLRKGRIAPSDARRILECLERYGLLGFREPIPIARVLEHLRYVRMIRGNRLHFVLPTGVGDVFITEDVTNDDLARAFEDYDALVRARGGTGSRRAARAAERTDDA